MATIDCWHVRDCACGKVEFRSWVARPGVDTLRCPSCGVIREAYTRKERFIAHVPFTSRKRFTPHFNTGFGVYVDSVEQFEHLKRKYNCEEVSLEDVKKHIPSDFDTREYLSRTAQVDSPLETVDFDGLDDRGEEVLDSAEHVARAEAEAHVSVE